jgi:DNA modification methylase
VEASVIDVLTSGHYVGDCRALLRQLPDGCVQTGVTSPPYWGHRDYGVDGQLGLEPTPAQYVANMVEVFREFHRVLRDDGTLWLNLGDSYVTNPRGPNGASSSTLSGTPDSERRQKRWAAAGRAGTPRFDKERQRAIRALAHPNNHSKDPKARGRSHAVAAARGVRGSGLKHKDLVGIPWRVAFALQDDGWWLRDDIIWHKPNPMPSPIDDRTTKAHEYVFLLSKSATYYYDATAIAEPSKEAGRLVPLGEKSFARRQMEGVGRGTDDRDEYEVPSTRNCRSVWTIATTGYDGAHFATMPPALAERCVLAGSRPGDLVLDMFFGSGTTGEVAEKHGRRWIGFDINPEYEKLQRERTAQRSLVLGGGGT